MNWETDWKLTLFQEFETSLFELKLLRPAFALLFALLPTMSVYFSNNVVSVTWAQKLLRIHLRKFLIVLFVKYIPTVKS